LEKANSPQYYVSFVPEPILDKVPPGDSEWSYCTFPSTIMTESMASTRGRCDCVCDMHLTRTMQTRFIIFTFHMLFCLVSFMCKFPQH
jgi:hypothetical protein